mmetsp:Transcript_26778/g.39664  ORF Transcript_26778/g.39664 Transcript_26778/m.39664 type:complete len:180 (-) Transcript_26778:161-700(-)
MKSISITRSSLLALIVTSAFNAASSTALLSASEMESIFLLYDVPEDDAPDCQAEAIDKQICPPDDNDDVHGLLCGPIENIVEYCQNLLGGPNGDTVQKYNGVKEDEGKNALAGCVKYVGFHVFTHDHMACCDSDFCEDWIGEQFEQFAMSDADGGGDGEGQYYDDDDVDDDDGFEGQEF